MRKSNKGSNYERDMCRKLSLWWTGGERDDIFWRSAGSGARAKVRGRSGRNTAGQHGDIAATDPIGKPLIDAFTIELKRGYSKHTAQDMLDKLTSSATQEFEKFFEQTIESWEQSGSYSWILITRRDRRAALVWMPMFTFKELQRLGLFKNLNPLARVRTNNIDVFGLRLDDWLAEVKPEHIKELL